MSKVKVGLIGSQFEAEIHAESFKRVADAELAAAASPTEAHVKELARKHGIRHWFTDYKKLLERVKQLQVQYKTGDNIRGWDLTGGIRYQFPVGATPAPPLVTKAPRMGS